MLEKLQPDDQRLIREAIDRSSVDLVGQALQGSAAHQDISDLLLHTRVGADSTIYMDWASDWVAGQFEYRAWKR